MRRISQACTLLFYYRYLPLSLLCFVYYVACLDTNETQAKGNDLLPLTGLLLITGNTQTTSTAEEHVTQPIYFRVCMRLCVKVHTHTTFLDSCIHTITVQNKHQFPHLAELRDISRNNGFKKPKPNMPI